MSPELIEILKEGGAWGVSIVLGVLLWKSNEARISEIKDHSKAMSENIATLDRLTKLIGEKQS